ncbi:MAG TPA: DsbE family thiol:disulfide interchange protein [Bauldia sp.]|nr:DsbE family thiol:disulfide interchange protein [Bauldia sp.]
MTSAPPQSAPVRPRRRLVLLLPLAVFAALAAVFLARLESGTDSEFIPSVLIGKPAPDFVLPGLEPGQSGLSRADLLGKVTLVNIFASWCGPCRDEHPQLQALSGDPGFRLVGINYKDNAANARRFLGELGNPYSAIGADPSGRASIDWGVYGVPETFLVGPDGVIRQKFVGPISAEALEKAVRPAVEEALKR